MMQYPGDSLSEFDELSGELLTLHQLAGLAGDDTGDVIAQRILFGADPDEEDAHGRTPAFVAAQQGNVEVLRALARFGAAMGRRATGEYTRRTPLMVAAARGDAACVSVLMQQQPQQLLDLWGDNVGGYTALHLAVLAQSEASVRCILGGTGAAGGDAILHARDYHGRTPLHLAVTTGPPRSRSVIAAMLVMFGARTDVRDNDGLTPLDLIPTPRLRSVLVSLFCPALSSNSRTDVLLRPRKTSRGHQLLILGHWMAYVGLHVVAYSHYSDIDDTSLFVDKVLFVLACALLAAFRFYDPGVVPPTRPPIVPMSSLPTSDLLHPSFCVTCQIMRPQRAKHCPHCNHCVEMLDHHCFYMGGCVGRGNRRVFILYLYTATIELGLATSWLFLHALGIDSSASATPEWTLAVVFGTIALGAFAFIAYMAVYQSLVIAANLTTNEHLNYERYKYLRPPQADTFPAYKSRLHRWLRLPLHSLDRGLVRNCVAFWADRFVTVLPAAHTRHTHSRSEV